MLNKETITNNSLSPLRNNSYDYFGNNTYISKNNNIDLTNDKKVISRKKLCYLIKKK